MHKFLVRAFSGIIYAAFIIAALLCGHWTIYALALLFASIGVCDIIGVYASWSPMTIFQAPFGPQLKSWSIGATINL